MSIKEKREKRLISLLDDNIAGHTDIFMNEEKPDRLIKLIDLYVETGKNTIKDQIVRYYKLFTELKKKNLTICENSSLCNSFIENNIDNENINDRLNQVVNEFVEMKWFYENTTYKESLKKIYNDYYGSKKYIYYDCIHSDYFDIDPNINTDYNHIENRQLVQNSLNAKIEVLRKWIINDMPEPSPPYTLQALISLVISEEIIEKNKIDILNINIYFEDKKCHMESIKFAKKYNKNNIVWINENDIYRLFMDNVKKYLTYILPKYIIDETQKSWVIEKSPKFIENINNFDEDLQKIIMEHYNKIKNQINIYKLSNNIKKNNSSNKEIFEKKCFVCKKNYYAGFCPDMCCSSCCKSLICKHKKKI
jgi:hypothetical protein